MFAFLHQSMHFGLCAVLYQMFTSNFASLHCYHYYFAVHVEQKCLLHLICTSALDAPILIGLKSSLIQNRIRLLFANGICPNWLRSCLFSWEPAPPKLHCTALFRVPRLGGQGGCLGGERGGQSWVCSAQHFYTCLQRTQNICREHFAESNTSGSLLICWCSIISKRALRLSLHWLTAWFMFSQTSSFFLFCHHSDQTFIKAQTFVKSFP